MTRLRVALALVMIAAIGVTAMVLQTVFPAGGPLAGPASVPTTAVERGPLELVVRTKGELRASRQTTVMAPSVGGGTIRILSIPETGESVRAGDVIVRLDPADQLYALEQAESEVLEAEQEIIKRRADIAAQQAQERVTILTAEFDVRRAELDTRADADLIGANEFKIRQVTLEEARRRLEQVRQDAGARTVTTEASLQVLEERMRRSRVAADQARQNIASLELTAPMDGIVWVRENQDSVLSGGILFPGMPMPTFRVGDELRPGRPVVDVFDISSMEIRASVDEQERGSVSPGQRATVWPATAPGVSYEATVLTVAGLGRADRAAGPLRQFEVQLALANPDNALWPGTTVEVLIHGETMADVLRLPRQAVFERDGQTVVYVPAADGSGRFDARPVSVLHRSEVFVAVEGLEEGTEVAVIDPASVRAPVEQSTPVQSAGGPGGRP